MRLLGECYNYLLLDSRTLFEQLYSCLSHGHDSGERAAKLDPPDDFFRVRMVGGVGGVGVVLGSGAWCGGLVLGVLLAGLPPGSACAFSSVAGTAAAAPPPPLASCPGRPHLPWPRSPSPPRPHLPPSPPPPCQVVTLLDTCGGYFNSGGAKRRLQRFLLLFQAYYLSKAAPPLDVEFDVQVRG
jgi:hypothetical protein